MDGWRYRAGDAVNFAIGQGDTTLTPLQLATVYSALSNGGTLWQPRVAEAHISPAGHRTPFPPKSRGRVPVPDSTLRYIDDALRDTVRTGTAAWKFTGFPLDKVPLRAKTGTAERYGKQTTSWLASYTDRYAVVMMISQAGTGSGASGDAVRHIWEGIYSIKGRHRGPTCIGAGAMTTMVSARGAGGPPVCAVAGGLDAGDRRCRAGRDRCGAGLVGDVPAARPDRRRRARVPRQARA